MLPIALSIFLYFQLDLSSFDLSTVTYTTSSDESTVTISLPSVDKSIQFVISVNGSEAAKLHEHNIDGSQKLTVSIHFSESLLPISPLILAYTIGLYHQDVVRARGRIYIGC